MYRLLDELEQREQLGSPLNIGLVGCGQMGSGMVNITYQNPGLRIKLIADLDVERGIKAFQEVGFDRDSILVSENSGEMQKALEAGKVAVTPDATTLTSVQGVEAIIEATGSTEVGAQVAYESILSGKHVIMLNVETDVTVGWLLKRMADKAGVIYTVSAGDEPGAVIELYRFARLMGFTLTAIGKGKNNPVNFYATPDELKAEAKEKGMNPRMLCAFVDGTKTMFEMAEVSNATGALPDIPGMHGAEVDVPDLGHTYIPREDGGLFNSGAEFVVDYSTGEVAPGVFLVFTTDSEHLRENLKFYSMGDGPYYTLCRPYHLCSFETPISVARACIMNEPTINSEAFHSEVVTVAKRDLAAGDTLDGIGGYDMYGKIYRFQQARKLNALPLGIAAGARIKRVVGRGEVITYDDVELNEDSFVVKLRGIQDQIRKGAE